jgi:hypothetical protein
MKKKTRKLQLTRETLVHLRGGTESLTDNTGGGEQATGSNCMPDCISNMAICQQGKTTTFV